MFRIFSKVQKSSPLVTSFRQLHNKNFIGNSIKERSPNAVDEAVQLALDAFPKLKVNGDKMGVFLDTIADDLQWISKDLIKTVMKETHYPEQRVTTEFIRTISQLRMFAKVSREANYVNARIYKQEGQPRLKRMLQPIGPVSVFGASNFPLAYSVPGGDTASAFAAHCPVIVKSHPAHEETSELCAEVIQKAVIKTGLPEGTFSMVRGDVEVGQELVKHYGIQAVGFTGSVKGGKALFDIAVRRPKPIPVYAEMGSINPVIILPEAIKYKGEEIAKGLCDSFTLSGGQFCTNPGFVLTVKDENSTFLDHLAKFASNVQPFQLLTEGITQSFKDGIKRFSSIPGVTIKHQVSVDDTSKVGATILTTDVDTFLKNKDVLSEEIFGPVTLVVSCNSLEDVKRIITNLNGQLTSSIHAHEKDEGVHELVSLLEIIAGRLIFNGFPTGVTVCSAMHHGGPFPATTDIRTGAVGKTSIRRWLRPISYQNFPDEYLPPELKDTNPQKIWREINDEWKME